MQTRTNNFDSQLGFTVMELLVALLLSLVVFAMVFSLLRNSIITANANVELGDATQSLRNSQEFISRDLITAGDGLRGIGNVRVPVGFVTQRLTARSASTVDPTTTGYVNIGTVLSDFQVPAGTAITNIAPAMNVLTGTHRITFLTVDSTFTQIPIGVGSANFTTGSISVPALTISQFNVGEIYFMTDGLMGVFGTITSIDVAGNRIFWANGDPYGLNIQGAAGPLGTVTTAGTRPTTLLRMQIVQYYVDDQGRLHRRVYGVRGSGHIDSIVAEHLTAMRFRYTLRPAGTNATIYQQPLDQVTVGDHGMVRLIEVLSAVESANPLQDNVKHQVNGSIIIGVRNLQFSEAAMPT